MLIENLTSDEFAMLRKVDDAVLIPFGATEGHGRHLPLDTDTLIASRVCRLAGEQARALVAPTVPYGVCRSSADLPGTLSISTGCLRRLILELLGSLYRQELRRFLLLSGHAGGTHNATLLDAAEEFLSRHADVTVAVACEHHLVMASAREHVVTVDDSHAGEIETSRLLFAAPEKVRSPLADAERPGFHPWILTRNKNAAWVGGVWGDPSLASAAKGEAIEAAVVAALIKLLAELRAVKL